jgi:hypothetical protein
MHWILDVTREWPGRVRRVLRGMVEAPDGWVLAATLIGFALAVAAQWMGS